MSPVRKPAQVLHSMRKMTPGTMGGESRVSTPPGPNWGVDVRGGSSPATNFCIDILPNQLVEVDSTYYSYPGNAANELLFDISTLVGEFGDMVTFNGDDTFGIATGPWDPISYYTIVSAQATITTDANPVDVGLQAFVELAQGEAIYNDTAAWLGPNGNVDIPENYTISTEDAGGAYPLVDWYTNNNGDELFVRLIVHPFQREMSFTDQFINIVSGILCVQWRIDA